MGFLLYFAYDQHMDEPTLARCARGAELFGPSRMPGHELALRDGALVLNPLSEGSVWGLLWLLPSEHLDALDNAHGVGAGQAERTTVRIISPAGPPAQAICYRASAGVSRVSNWSLILKAAAHHKLPPDYRKRLEKLGGRIAENLPSVSH